MSNLSDQNTTSQAEIGKTNKGDTVTIAGYEAHRRGHPETPVIPHRSDDELDAANLAKLRSAGLPISHLDEALEGYNIGCARVFKDMLNLLAKRTVPCRYVDRKRIPIIGEEQVTALVFLYPDLTKQGEVYDYKRFVRIRYAAKDKSQRPTSYCQPEKVNTWQSTTEPYFLQTKEIWDRIHDPKQIILSTEGELKSIAVGLAGYACISFPGCDMWHTKDSNRLHESLDPNGPWKKWALPLIGKTFYLLPDADYRWKERVKKAFNEYAQALRRAGAIVYIIHLPDSPAEKDWKGIDDYLFSLLGPAWAGDPKLVSLANAAVKDLIDNRSERISGDPPFSPFSLMPVTERLVQKSSVPQHRRLVATIQNCVKQEVFGIIKRTRDSYILVERYSGKKNESGRTSGVCEEIYNESVEEYNWGINNAMENGLLEGEAPAMDPRFPAAVLAQYYNKLQHCELDTFIEPYSGVDDDDKCVGIRGGIINLTKCFENGVKWENRATWLLPPTDKWVSLTRLNTTFSNIQDEPQCPLFMETITNAFAGDAESISCLQLCMGKIVTSPIFVGKPQKFFSMYGAAGSGKSTIIELITELVGKTGVVTLDEDSDSRFAASELPGKKLIMFRDTEEHFSIKMGSLIKRIVGEDTIRVERKNAHAQEFDIRAEIVTVGNDPPVIPMNSEALRRRAVFLKFVNAIKNQNSYAKPKMISEELAGILLWSLRGAARLWNGENILTPRLALADLEDIIDDFIPEKQFIIAQLIRKPGAFLSNSKLMEAYQSWLIERRKTINKLSMRKLNRYVREHFNIDGTTTERVDGDTERGFTGLATRDQPTPY